MALAKKKPATRTSDYVKLPKETVTCIKCGGLIPAQKRSDAKYCSEQCKVNAEKKRYRDRNPDYVERQRRLVQEWRHMKEHGHLEFIDRPDLNPKDRFALARSLGFRSMLEYNIAKQLTELGVNFYYEPFCIEYIKAPIALEEDGDYETWTNTKTSTA